MWFTIIFALGGIVCLIISKLRWGNDDDSGGGLLVIGLFSIVILTWMPPLLIGELVDDKLFVETETVEANLLSIKDNSLVEGRFYLLAGSISTETYYFYYTQAIDGAIELKKIPTASVRLYEDSTPDTAYILRIEKSIPKKLIDSTKWYYFPDTTILLRREIHVPAGTVVRNFVLDAE
ncbi:hypothetical protein LCGC14_1337340 [marine sediment metagenome]|uniref:Uncharacterized protein n=1 Tax=marine sediment metagenome TaxID=412755 RepID=A0A0F9KEI9_9ZZZZ